MHWCIRHPADVVLARAEACPLVFGACSEVGLWRDRDIIFNNGVIAHLYVSIVRDAFIFPRYFHHLELAHHMSS